MEALGKREYRRFNAVMSTAIAGTTGTARLEAAIDVAATFLLDQPPRHMIDLDPGFVNGEVARVLPMFTAALTEVFAADLAAAIARTAMSHYVFPDPDATAARRQMRAAAGLSPSREPLLSDYSTGHGSAERATPPICAAPVAGKHPSRAHCIPAAQIGHGGRHAASENG